MPKFSKYSLQKYKSYTQKACMHSRILLSSNCVWVSVCVHACLCVCDLIDCFQEKLEYTHMHTQQQSSFAESILDLCKRTYSARLWCKGTVETMLRSTTWYTLRRRTEQPFAGISLHSYEKHGRYLSSISGQDCRH